MLALGIIILVIAIMAFIIAIFVSDNEDSVLAGFTIALFFVLGVMMIVASIPTESRKSTKDHTVKTEIQQKVVNGVVTESDTIYIFTEKK